jgi:hypothetical protein
MIAKKRRGMQQVQVAPPRLVLEQDADYVECFQELCNVGIKLRRNGRSVPLLVRKAIVALRMGSLHAARDAAQSALEVDRRCQEAHWLRAVALLCLCMQRLGLVDEGPCQVERDEVEPTEEDLLADARFSLVDCVRLSRRRDEQAVQLLDYLDTILAARLQTDALARALADLVGLEGYLPPRTPIRGE